ncbi:MAG: hypothetical protein IH874_02770 [Candidatus Dadabacteria bacterium]|nr:hypothetical protein [Candidatus Dadabacteria bacterium]
MNDRAVILVMKDWRERAFLRAELIERGINTLAVETLVYALEWPLGPHVDPGTVASLVIYDCKDQENPAKDCRSLMELSRTVPVLLLVPSGTKPPGDTFASGFKHAIKRPASIGAVADRAQTILEGGPKFD